MKSAYGLILVLALASCAPEGATTSNPPSGSAPQRVETVQINKDVTVYDVTYTPADPMTGGPKVSVARRGGAFMITDQDKALGVAQQYCSENGRTMITDMAMVANRVDGVWEFVNLCR